MPLLHHLAGSGGTLISRCLASMKGVCFLSEIHPLGTRHFHPLRQAAEWYGLVDAAEIRELESDEVDGFAKALAMIAGRAEKRRLSLVVRDWSHLDFVGFPFVSKPRLRFSWEDVITEQEKRCATVRHPLDQYLQCREMKALGDAWDEAAFWRGTRAFAESVQQMPWFRYEDFLEDPQATLADVCRTLAIAYDPDWQQKWHQYTNMTGDSVRVERKEIRFNERSPVSRKIWADLRKNEDFHATLDMLGYPIPEPLRRRVLAEGNSEPEQKKERKTKAKDWDAEVVRWRSAVQDDPVDMASQLRLAEALRWIGCVDEAVDLLLALCCDAEQRLSSDSESHLLLVACTTLEKAGRKVDSLPLRRRVLELRPSHRDNLFQLSALSALIGEIDESLTYCRELLRLDRGDSVAAANCLLYMNYSDRYTAAEISKEHFRLGIRFTERPVPLAKRQRAVNEKIRIGYLAADFYTHPVGKIILPILESHDRDLFHVTVYHDSEQFDEITKATEQAVDRFVLIQAMEDEAVAQAIRQDQLDVLIELGGYTGGGNRLRVLSKRVAPVQVSFLGYPNTTALQTIDYHLTDRFADPPGTAESLYGEQLIWLDHAHLAWRPYPEVANVSVASRGAPLLGVFNNIAKISPTAIAAYATILKKAPQASVLFKYGDRYSIRSVQDRYRREFASCGVLPRQLRFQTRAETLETHLQTMMSVDLALDAFPYQGTMTSLECLSVGTPIVSCCGEFYAHRATSAMMIRLGMPELVAGDAEEYVEIAVQMLNDLSRLRELRAELRRRFLASTLTDPVGLVREIETRVCGWV
ncbi:O-linked N-acetylglucosamine transferase, SPINDLY family protein [Novipirellula artificiosorum]|uniref:O-GlcNAc transferase C-terminal domain-containing protein n=1 Tax=Novipirellula artificiosorum TaxID=2528016 RepID=A0A5C6DZZ1_9BACT|nr:hypothetical protein [Novipirellula artificiosorum]TWU42180.1 hypothetical protein Poly41_04760 [Novipirellula artificiosorum]